MGLCGAEGGTGRRSCGGKLLPPALISSRTVAETQVTQFAWLASKSRQVLSALFPIRENGRQKASNDKSEKLKFIEVLVLAVVPVGFEFEEERMDASADEKYYSLGFVFDQFIHLFLKRFDFALIGPVDHEEQVALS